MGSTTDTNSTASDTNASPTMNLVKATVTAACTPGEPYTFKAQGPDNNVVTVNLVMPLGGVQSGLYRSPQLGESVLVAAVPTAERSYDYYLMGYLPGEKNQAFSSENEDKNDLTSNVVSNKGQVFRYKNTAKAFGGKNAPHSEIGFYTKAHAEWPATAGGTDNPSIDTVNIESAGDIKETAANHHFQRAKRMELFVNVPEVDHTKPYTDKNRPFGDKVGDDSELHGGDFHIRAGKRVVIKAGSEIRLQVGRTTLVIDDGGFTVITRNVAGNFINSFDTALQMTPRDGITLTGKTISIGALYKLNANDGWGGSLTSIMGNLSISGREIGINSKDNAEFTWLGVLQSVKYLLNSISAGCALNGSVKDAGFTNYFKTVISAWSTLNTKIRKIVLKNEASDKLVLPSTNQNLTAVVVVGGPGGNPNDADDGVPGVNPNDDGVNVPNADGDGGDQGTGGDANGGDANGGDANGGGGNAGGDNGVGGGGTQETAPPDTTPGPGAG